MKIYTLITLFCRIEKKLWKSVKICEKNEWSCHYKVLICFEKQKDLHVEKIVLLIDPNSIMVRYLFYLSAILCFPISDYFLYI